MLSTLVLAAGLGGCGGVEPVARAAPAPARPDPTPYVPPSTGAGAAVPSGQVAGLQGGGRVVEARATFTEFFMALQRKDVTAVSDLLMPRVLLLRGRRTRERTQLLKGLPRLFRRLRLEPQPPEDLVDPSGIEVLDLEGADDRFPEGALSPGDLIVTGRVHFRLPRGRAARDQVRTVVLRPNGRRLGVAILDRWPPVP